MSWFSTNYDKAFLGGGGLIALGLLYFGWSQLQASDKDFDKDLRGRGGNSSAVEGAEKIAKTRQSQDLDHGWKPGDFEGRKVDLFTGIPLFIKRDTGGKPLDLLKGAPVHPPIDNEFWINYGVDPGFGDSPQRDPDADGFTNLEEFNAGTDPTNSEDHPPLIAKLRYIEDDSMGWLLKPGFLNQDGAVPMTYEDTKGGKNKADVSNPLKPGQLFFANGVAQGRFKYVEHIKKEENNPALNVMVEVTMVKIEDQKANKAGKVYEIPAPLKTGQRAKFIQYDRSAVLDLEALGKDGNRFTIEENTRFSLPDGQEEKPFLLKSVSPEEIVVEYTDSDGNVVPVTIKKGALPRL